MSECLKWNAEQDPLKTAEQDPPNTPQKPE